MENVFLEIKSRLAMPEVARFYGLEVSGEGIDCCPFHADKTPRGKKIWKEHLREIEGGNDNAT